MGRHDGNYEGAASFVGACRRLLRLVVAVVVVRRVLPKLFARDRRCHDARVVRSEDFRESERTGGKTHTRFLTCSTINTEELDAKPTCLKLTQRSLS